MQAAGTAAEWAGAAVVRVERTLRAPVGSGLRHTVQALLRRGEQQVVLDLEPLEAIDAAGIGELVAAFTAARAAGRALRIARPRRRVRCLLQVTGVLGLLSAGQAAESTVTRRHERRPHLACPPVMRSALSCV